MKLSASFTLLVLLFSHASAAQQVAPDSTRLRSVLDLHQRATRDTAARRAYLQIVLNPDVVLPGLGFYTDAAMWLGADSVAAGRKGATGRLAEIQRGLRLVDDKVTAAALLPDYTRRWEAARQSNDTSVRSLEDRVYRLNITLWQGLASPSQHTDVASRAREAESRKSAARDRSNEALNRQVAAEERASRKVSSYEGQKLNSLPEGRGVLVYANGDRYEGAFHLGRRHGHGVFELANGLRFEGPFVEGDFGPDGTLEMPTGTRYVGELRGGRRSGRGVLELASGERYVGGFLGDQFEGDGVLEYADGGRYDGGWHGGKRQGHGRDEYANGRVLEGWFENDRYVGPEPSTMTAVSAASPVIAQRFLDPQSPAGVVSPPAPAMPRPLTVTGTVKDVSTGKPVSEASVYLNRVVTEARSGKDGRVNVPAEIPVEMIVRRAGYVPLTINVGVDRSDLGEIRLRPVRTTDDQDSVRAMDLMIYPHLTTFYEHKAQYPRGSFFGPDDLERQAGTIPDVVRREPRFRNICVVNRVGELDCGKADRGPNTIMGTGKQAMAEERLCGVDVWTDDVGPERTLDEIPIRQVLALEAYPDPGSSPNKLGGKCASVRLWMKRAIP